MTSRTTDVRYAHKTSWFTIRFTIFYSGVCGERIKKRAHELRIYYCEAYGPFFDTRS